MNNFLLCLLSGVLGIIIYENIREKPTLEIFFERAKNWTSGMCKDIYA